MTSTRVLRSSPRRNGLTSAHLFCGWGGDTEGFQEAGFQPVVAANHAEINIRVHAKAFPDAEHLCVDISNYDMRNLPKTDVLWASPICTEISPAGGRKRAKAKSHGQLELLEYGSVPDEAWERTRATAYDVIRATELNGYDAVFCENVIEFATDWPLFWWWLDGFEKLGYNNTITCVSSAHIGGGGNPYAPQWRDRLYIVFTKKGVRKPDLSPRPLALCVECGEDVNAVQWWKDPKKRQIGKYRSQYLYRCPNWACKHSIVEPYVLAAASAIDWSNLGERIGDRVKPLAAATRARIQAGLEMFARQAPPMMVPAGGMRADRVMSALDEPMRTRLANPKGFEALCTPPFMVNSNHDDLRVYPTDSRPLSTRSTKIGDGVVVPPFITVLRNNCDARSIDEPGPTIASAGNHLYLTVPDAFYVKNYGVAADAQRMAKPVTDPLSAVVANGAHHALVIPYYSNGKARTTDVPLSALTAKDRFGLLRDAPTVDECHYRMFQPHEHLRAQRFPEDYPVEGNKGQQTAGAGNAVSVNVARWIGEQTFAALDATGTVA